jgi:mannonate dehydratase
MIRTCLATFYPVTDERLRFIKQLGIDETIVWATTYQDIKELSVANILSLRQRVEDAGLKIFAFETLPSKFYNKVMLGQEGRDRQIADYQQIISNLGQAGIRSLGYNWMPTGVWRTSYSNPLRGGAKGILFDQRSVQNEPLSFEREYSEEECWDYYQYWLERVLPVAEEANVVLSIHPNDPPLADKLGGVPQLFRSKENFDKALNMLPSTHHKLTLCLGGWSAMGENIVEVVKYYGEQDKIDYVHFQSSNGVVPYFAENFIDQADYNPFEVVKALKSVNFDGVMIPGHVPQIEGDDEWRDQSTLKANPDYTHPMGGHRARAYTIGFMKGLIMAAYPEVYYKDIR